jgi:hypothetical protein
MWSRKKGRISPALLFRSGRASTAGVEPQRDVKKPRVRQIGTSPFGSGNHHVDIPAAALGANQPSVPFGHWRLRTIPACLISRVGFAPVTTCFTPDHKPDVSRGSVPERHRWAPVGLHPRRRRYRPLLGGSNVVAGAAAPLVRAPATASPEYLRLSRSLRPQLHEMIPFP